MDPWAGTRVACCGAELRLAGSNLAGTVPGALVQVVEGHQVGIGAGSFPGHPGNFPGDTSSVAGRTSPVAASLSGPAAGAASGLGEEPGRTGDALPGIRAGPADHREACSRGDSGDCSPCIAVGTVGIVRGIVMGGEGQCCSAGRGRGPLLVLVAHSPSASPLLPEQLDCWSRQWLPGRRGFYVAFLGT